MTLVSDNIRYLRKLNGLTQEQFSRKINIKRSLLGAYEEGRANPNQQNIQTIAKAFNTTVELLTRQDLRKLRETPNLSIPLGQKTADVYAHRNDRGSSDNGPSIRSDGKLADDDDPFQHPDFPDIFSQPTPPTPEPQPLSSVLNKYYKTQDEPRRVQDTPVPPVITPPVRPGVPNAGNERPVQPTFQPQPDNRQSDRTGQSAVDRLFASQPDPKPRPEPVRPNTPTRQTESLTFNNIYEGSSNSAYSSSSAQPIAPTIPVVMQRQFAEYGQRFQQADFLHRLPAMHLPTLPEGHYRAFEAGDDFAFPGALLVGKFTRNWFDIADGKLYILLIHQQPTGSAICCRRVYNQVKVKGSLLLTADRADIANREVALKDVLEVWEIAAFVSQQLPPPAPNTDRLRQLVDELRFEVERL
ncbi:helix-turn-helix domain-containing protein [Spirosoma sp. HMF4905]|uniref:Helix-turn-helix domain-containing protein n=1 Tax=Spirosoma arboris TaxID=2682092 RepID=A0A7K1SA42_9BACT|nr:helix-turn-helix transcriptional regulator [Spirosoma arboris]MVM30528.1 helix-turn-helix domain-containing protein [Spirosoma arboris]